MFDQFKQIKSLAGLMGNAEEIKKRIAQVQEELGRQSVTADAGAGAVRVTVSGKLEVLRVELDRPLIAALGGAGDDADQAMIEELIVSATNEALRRAQAMIKQEITKQAGGLNLPGLEGLTGGLGGGGPASGE